MFQRWPRQHISPIPPASHHKWDLCPSCRIQAGTCACGRGGILWLLLVTKSDTALSFNSLFLSVSLDTCLGTSEPAHRKSSSLKTAMSEGSCEDFSQRHRELLWLPVDPVFADQARDIWMNVQMPLWRHQHQPLSDYDLMRDPKPRV